MPAQGKFYSHQKVDADLSYCPAPRRLGAAAGKAREAPPRRLDDTTTASRTLASRTDLVVCEPPRRLDAGASDAPRPIPARPAAAAAPTLPEPDSPPPLPASAPAPLVSASTAPPAPVRADVVDTVAAQADRAPTRVDSAPAPEPPAPPSYVIEAAPDGGLVVTVGPIDGCASAAELDLTVHPARLVLAGPCMTTLTVALDVAVDANAVRAKWRKKERKLRVALVVSP